MDQKAKKLLKQVKNMIQQKKYEQASLELQVMVYKYPKNYQIHLMSGGCYHKLMKLQQAQKAFLQVLDLKPDEPYATKFLCDVYKEMNKIDKETKYLQILANIHKKNSDKSKYQDVIAKLVEIYETNEEINKINLIYEQYLQKQPQITNAFVRIANCHFRVCVKNKSFNLQEFEMMGVFGESIRPLQQNAKVAMNKLLIQIKDYLYSMRFTLDKNAVSNSICEMKKYFPQATVLLMLILLDQYCVSQIGCYKTIIFQIQLLLKAYYHNQNNDYKNCWATDPEIFSVMMILSYQYLSFMNYFFVLNVNFYQFYDKLSIQQEQFLNNPSIKLIYKQKIKNFILSEYLQLSKAKDSSVIKQRLKKLRKRISAQQQQSYLQEAFAKIILNSSSSYSQLNKQKNNLKIKIKNLKQQQISIHLLKYYYDYLFKIANCFKILDQEVQIYWIIQKITQIDQHNKKYLIELLWLNVCRNFNQLTAEQWDQNIIYILNEMKKILVSIDKTLKGEVYRKIGVLYIIIGKEQEAKQFFEKSLAIERSFATLSSIGIYLYIQQKYQKALEILKEAFTLNHFHYHTNRTIIMCMLKINQLNEVLQFIQRIKQGFTTVFWVNYILAMKYLSLKKFKLAENYLTEAVKNFQSYCNINHRFNYEKTIERQKYACLYLIQQNQYHILQDIIIPAEYIAYQVMPILTSFIFRIHYKSMKIQIYTQIGEVLKILGQTKSAWNYLTQAYQFMDQFSKEQKQSQRLKICLLSKQYATILFYMRMFKQSETVLLSGLKFLQDQIQTKQDKKLQLKIQCEFKALKFQISVERFATMIKFESFEASNNYLDSIKIQKPEQLSLNFLKSQYQFKILKYLHKRQNIQQVIESIDEFLNYFQLRKEQITTNSFANLYFKLDQTNQILIRQCLEDLHIIYYIGGFSVKSDQIMPLIQLFPRSTVFYIIFGMTISDIKLKTAAFLKCIQLDKESPISIELLASLYLKQKNYTAAAKLFLNSLEINKLNPKSYLGLSICLFAITGQLIASSDLSKTQLIEKCLSSINSYLQYLKTVDPSENYHILKFIQLINKKQALTSFQIKTTLENVFKNTKKDNRSMLHQLFNLSIQDWKNFNVWVTTDHQKIISQYLTKLPMKQYNQKEAYLLAEHINKQCYKAIDLLTKQIKQIDLIIVIKTITLILNRICINLQYLIKYPYKQELMIAIIQLIKYTYNKFKSEVDLQITLSCKIKQYLYSYYFQNNKYHKQIIDQIDSILPEAKYIRHLVKYRNKIPSINPHISKILLNDPSNNQYRSLLSSQLVVNFNKPIVKGNLSYKVALLNNIHHNELQKMSSYKKLILLYNDYNAWVCYIENLWCNPIQRTENKLKLWCQILQKIEKNSQLSSYRKKLTSLRVQILAYYSVYFNMNPKLMQGLTKDQNKLYKFTIKINLFMKMKEQKLKTDIVKLLSQLQWESGCQWPLCNLLSFLVKNYVSNTKVLSILKKCIKVINYPTIKGCILLLIFINILYKQVQNQQELIDQIEQLSNIIDECSGLVSYNSLIFLRCFKHQLSSDLQSLEEQFISARKKNNIFESKSDQILINYFQIMLLYNKISQNINTQGVVQNFNRYCQIIIESIHLYDPKIEAYFLNIQSKVNSLVLSDYDPSNDVNLKKLRMLNPEGINL